jgi:hypothetical protein
MPASVPARAARYYDWCDDSQSAVPDVGAHSYAIPRRLVLRWMRPAICAKAISRLINNTQSNLPCWTYDHPACPPWRCGLWSPSRPCAVDVVRGGRSRAVARARSTHGPSRWHHTAAGIGRETPAIICVAGRELLDGTTFGILSRNSRKRCFIARLVSCDDVSRAKVETPDTTNVAIVRVSFLGIGGSPAHLRYLIRRLRCRLY